MSPLLSGGWLAAAAHAAGPAQMYKRKVDPDALLEVMSRPQILLSLAACLAAAIVGLLARRVVRASPLTGEHRERLGQIIPLALVAGLVFVLAVIWQPKIGAVQLVLGALAVGLTRGLVGFTRPFTAFLLRISAEGMRRGSLVRVGPVCGRLLVTTPRTSRLACAIDGADPGALSGALITCSNGLFFRAIERIDDSLPCEVNVVVPQGLAVLTRQRLERAGALSSGDVQPTTETLSGPEPAPAAEVIGVGDKALATVTLTLQVPPGEVRATRDRVLERYLELAPTA